MRNIGSIGFLALAASMASAEVFTVTSVRDDGPGTLREAVMLAGMNGPGLDTVDMAALDGTVGLTTPIALDSELLIVGPGHDGLVISGGESTRLFDVSAHVTIQGVTLRKGRADYGGAIHNRGTLRLSDVRFHNNAAEFDGGAIFDEGRLEAADCLFETNHAPDGWGGAVYERGRGLSLTRCRFATNVAESGGGAVVVDGLAGRSQISSCAFQRNTCAGPGGALRYREPLVTPAPWHFVGDSTFRDDNSKGENGGGIASAANLLVERVSIAHAMGGCVQQIGGVLVLRDSTFRDSSSGSKGTGLEQVGGELYMTQCTVSGNAAWSSGAGGLYLDGDRAVIMQSTITDNWANGFDGMGVWVGADTDAAFGNSVVAANVGSSFGGLAEATSLGHNVYGWHESYGLAAVATDIPAFFESLNSLGLDVLGFAGGPTWTHALYEGCVAVDAGTSSLAVDAFDGAPLLFDQRGPGFPRTVGGAVDIGAVERQSP